MGKSRLLIVRLGSMGDVLHALPAVHALREAHPEAQIDWVVEPAWRALLEGNPDLNRVIVLDRTSWRGLRSTVLQLRANGYDTAIDFQGLYKSAVLARLSGARERIGFDRSFARESGAAMFYTQRVQPTGAHVVEHNLALAAAAGAQCVKLAQAQFPLRVQGEASGFVESQLAERGVNDFFVLSPGGGWGSKCWPAERYGHLHRRLLEIPAFAGMRGVVNFGPGERKLAEAVRLVAGDPEPVLLPLDLAQLMALTQRAKFFVGGDTGPMHLAVALGVPVVALFGPTNPVRNGPVNAADVVVRNAASEETTYKREKSPAASMLSITVEQVLNAVCRRMGVTP